VLAYLGVRAFSGSAQRNDAASRMMLKNAQQQMAEQQQEARETALALSKKRELTSIENLSGIWIGNETMAEEGHCDIRLQLTETDPPRYKAFLTLQCKGDPMHDIKEFIANPNTFGAKTDPVSSELNGEPENSGISFKLDESTNPDAKGCIASDFEVYPFGSRRIRACWDHEDCQVGQVVLEKTANWTKPGPPRAGAFSLRPFMDDDLVQLPLPLEFLGTPCPFCKPLERPIRCLSLRRIDGGRTCGPCAEDQDSRETSSERKSAVRPLLRGWERGKDANSRARGPRRGQRQAHEGRGRTARSETRRILGGQHRGASHARHAARDGADIPATRRLVPALSPGLDRRKTGIGAVNGIASR
jgi:hypothetical protein